MSKQSSLRWCAMVACAAFSLTLMGCPTAGPGGGGGNDNVNGNANVNDNGGGGGGNQAPTANAGAFQQVNGGDAVQLDGSGSSDPDGDALTYAWSQTGGSSVTLTDRTGLSPRRRGSTSSSSILRPSALAMRTALSSDAGSPASIR